MPDALEPPPCWTCGYDLTGIPADGRCPECGTTVRDSWARARELLPRSGAYTALAFAVVSLLMLRLGPLACVPGISAAVLGQRALYRARKIPENPDTAAAWLAIAIGWGTTAIGVLVTHAWLFR